MDILAGVSAEWLKWLTWIVAAVCGVAMLAWRPRRPDQAVLASLLVFITASVGAGIYVLNHLADGRWGGDAQSKLSAPSLSGAPVVGDFLKPLEGALGGMADGVNDFIDFQSALPVALDYFAAAGWALAVTVPVGLLVLAGSARAARRRTAEVARHATELERLRAELERVKRHVGYPAEDII
ncbi:hypothetical protein M1D93_03915 [Arthrobacter sp. Z1-9]